MGRAHGHPTWARLNGVFFGAFLLFSWTCASILSGAVIERIRSSAFWLFAVMLGSITWVVDAAWGWSGEGWMVRLLGYHDAYASGVIHAVSGGSALAVLYHLGPRIGRFRSDGTPRAFPPQNSWLVIIGLFMIYTGFWGFYAACNIPIIDIDPDSARTFFAATTIYLTPTTLSASARPTTRNAADEPHATTSAVPSTSRPAKSGMNTAGPRIAPNTAPKRT